MPALSSYSNVYNTCYLILRKKGWRFWVIRKRKHPEAFWAEKNGWDLWADSPIELLGLVAIYEWKCPKSYKEYWWVEEGPHLIGKLRTRAPKYRRVGERKGLVSRLNTLIVARAAKETSITRQPKR